MNWSVDISEIAEQDIESIYQHIATSLMEPRIAWKQVERIRARIDNLDTMPERNRVIQFEPWKSRNARRLNVDNYAAFYVLENESSTVTVFRVLYAKCDLTDTSLID